MSRIGFKTSMVAGGTTLSKHVMVTVPKREFGEDEITALNGSTLDREFIPTLRDNGVCTVEANYIPADYTAITALHGVPDKSFVCVSVDPDAAGPGVGQTFTMTGFVKTISDLKFEKDKTVKFSFDVRVNKIDLT